jgi:hypothetical protein
MDGNIWIILYSKYSKACESLFGLIKSLNVPTNFQLLEIDNKNLRKRIKKDERFSITCVPCLVSINQLGIASQYDGEKAFEIVKMMHVPPPQPSRIQRTHAEPMVSDDLTPQPLLVPSSAAVSHPESTPVTSLVDEQQAEPSQGFTSIDDLMDESTPLPAHLPKKTVIDQKKTGSKISVSDIMAQANKNSN